MLRKTIYFSKFYVSYDMKNHKREQKNLVVKVKSVSKTDFWKDFQITPVLSFVGKYSTVQYSTVSKVRAESSMLCVARW